MNDTQRKGQIAELQVALDMARMGYAIAWPVPNEVYDFIATRGAQVLRVQCKTVRHRIRDGKHWLVIDCTDSAGNRYAEGTVDLFGAYDPASGRVFYLTYSELNGNRERWIDATKLLNYPTKEDGECSYSA